MLCGIKNLHKVFEIKKNVVNLRLDCGNNSTTFWKIEATCLFLLIENLRNFHFDMQGKGVAASTFRRGLHLYPFLHIRFSQDRQSAKRGIAVLAFRVV